MEQKILKRKPKKKKYDIGLLFKAKMMGIKYDTLYRYRTGRQPKPADYWERYLPACDAWDAHVFIAKHMGIGTRNLSCYLNGEKKRPNDFEISYEAAYKAYKDAKDAA